MNANWIMAGTILIGWGLGMLHPGLLLIFVGGLCFLWASPPDEDDETEDETETEK